MKNHRFRTGDHIKHRPSGENWVVAYADYQTGKLAPCGWPDGEADISDCQLMKAVDDHGNADLLAELAVSGDRRGARANAIAQEVSRAAA